MFHWMSESSLVQKWAVYQRCAHRPRQTDFAHVKRCEPVSASFDSNIHGREHGILCTVQPWKSSKRHSAPRSHLCMAHILSSALTDRETDLLTTYKSSQLEGSCPKGRNGEEVKKSGRVTPDQREALLWPTGAQVFEVLIKIHTE